MRRALITAPGALEVGDAPIPGVPPGHVRLRVTAAGICGSDLHTYAGQNPVIPLPIAAGHEFSGTIDAVADDLTGWEIGTLVAARPSVPCGDCWYCQHDAEHLCDALKFVGSFIYDGAFAEYVVLPAECLTSAPEQTAAVLTFAEPAAAAVHSVALAGEIAGNRVLVVGCGTIGLLVAQVARLSGADVFATDLIASKVDLAQTFGVKPAARDGDLFVDEDGEPFAVSFDCVGKRSTTTAALRSLRKGGRMVLVGVPTEAVVIDPVDLLIAERTITGSFIYTNAEFDRALALLRSGAIRVREMVTASYDLEHIGEAFAAAANGNERVKLLIEP